MDLSTFLERTLMLIENNLLRGLCFLLCTKIGIDRKIILSLFHFICSLFYFEMSQNIIMFLKIKVINLLMFLLYPYFINNSNF